MEDHNAPVREGDILAAKYKVERVLGVGGMGVVVAARHLQLHQRVALKFLLPQSLLKSSVVARFEREARAAVRLRSEHVARVIDVGTMESGAPYIVMEFLEGEDLGDLVEKSGPLPPVMAVDYILQACEAVAEAHSLGIVHRDLKPRNLFLTQRVDGRPLVKVLDFGISKVTGVEELSLTGTAEIIGSPNYMSPEQLRASKLADARSDIWAMGAILYELLTGYVPFQAETLTQLCTMVLQDPPRPLSELRADVSPGLVGVIERCLEKDPSRRFQSVGDLAAALAPFTTTSASTAAERAMAVGNPSGRLPAAESSAVAISALASSSSARIAVAGGGGTSVSWGHTQLARSTSHAKLYAVGGLLALVVVSGIGLAAFKVLRKDLPTNSALASSSARPTPPPPDSIIPPPPPPPPPPPSSSSSSVTAATAGTAAAAPSLTSPASSSRPAGSAHATKPTKPGKPPPRPSPDDLPSVRN